jgi:hypothetical protein
VTGAKLRLYASSFKTGRTLQALQISAAWTEGGVTWNNKPATTGVPANTASGSGYLEWIVTSQVQNMYTAANYGFLVRDRTEGGSGIEQVFHSREIGTANPPRLIIMFGTSGMVGVSGKNRASLMPYRAHVRVKNSQATRTRKPHAR